MNRGRRNFSTGYRGNNHNFSDRRYNDSYNSGVPPMRNLNAGAMGSMYGMNQGPDMGSSMGSGMSQFPGNQSQIELASQILSAVLSSSSTNSYDRPLDPPSSFRSRSPDFRSGPAFQRRHRSRSPPPHRRFDKFEPRRGSFRGRHSRPNISKYKRFQDERKPDFGRKRRYSGDSGSIKSDGSPSKRLKGETAADPTTIDQQSQHPDASKDPKEAIDPTLLHCHMCNHGGFTSEDTYLFHLEGKRHQKTAFAFHEKNAAVLEYLRKNAQLACQRIGQLNRSVPPTKCTICHAVVRESFVRHKKKLEHKLVMKFLTPKCCGKYFKNHHDMDEHRLSLPHLKKVRESNCPDFTAAEDVPAGDPSDMISSLKQKMNNKYEPIERVDFMPPFDGHTMIGLEMLKTGKSMFCEACQRLLPSDVRALQSHLISLTHYNSVTEYLRAKKRESFGEQTKDQKSDNENETNDNGQEANDDGDEDEEHIPYQSEDEDDNLMFDESQHIILEEVGEKLDSDMEDILHQKEDEAPVSPANSNTYDKLADEEPLDGDREL